MDVAPNIPSHWLPMHGDLVPWNLREDRTGAATVLDWEDAGWGPHSADLFRFIVACYSLRLSNPVRIAGRVRSIVAAIGSVLQQVTSFWLQHRNFLPAQNTRNWPRQKARDAARGAREFVALHVLAGQVEQTIQRRETAPERERRRALLRLVRTLSNISFTLSF